MNLFGGSFNLPEFIPYVVINLIVAALRLIIVGCFPLYLSIVARSHSVGPILSTLPADGVLYVGGWEGNLEDLVGFNRPEGLRDKLSFPPVEARVN
jgi:hypothetical protein